MTRTWYWHHIDPPTIHRLEIIDHERRHLHFRILKEHASLMEGAEVDLNIEATDEQNCTLRLTLDLNSDMAKESYRASIEDVIHEFLKKDMKEFAEYLDSGLDLANEEGWRANSGKNT